MKTYAPELSPGVLGRRLPPGAVARRRTQELKRSPRRAARRKSAGGGDRRCRAHRRTSRRAARLICGSISLLLPLQFQELLDLVHHVALGGAAGGQELLRRL